MTTALEAFINEQRIRLGQERRELDEAIAKLTLTSKKGIQCQRSPGKVQDPTAISFRDTNVKRAVDIKSPGRSPGTGSQQDIMNHKQQKKKVVLSNDEPPKYGLPGMGEYEEKRKQYEDEWKKECRKHFAEEATKQPRGRGHPETRLDYDTILAQRREEEQTYRQINGDPYYSRNIKASTSDGYLNRDAVSFNDYRDFGTEARNLQPEIEELGGTYRNESRSIKNLNEYIDSNGVTDQYNRPHSYPQPYTTGAGYWQADKPESDPGFRDYNGVLDPQRKSFSLPRNGVKTRNDNPPRRTSQERPQSPVFISLGPPTSEVSKTSVEKRLAYQADLAKQMEETRLRKQKDKEEQMRYEQKIDEDNSNYNPWGRGGAGAPRRDSRGNVISNRHQPQQGHSLPKFEGNPAVDTRKFVRYQNPEPDLQKFQTPLGPEPYFGKRIENKGAATSNYQLELQQQILEKKRREMEEKEKELMEEALWTRRIEEQQEKMKREYNDELRKQQTREEQLRKRNEELRNVQEQQRLDAQRKMKEDRELARKEWWEAQQRGQNFQAESDEAVSNGNSPPIPAVRKAELPALRNASEANGRIQSKMNQKADNTQLAGVYTGSRTNILSQLSVMRQQLEQEQKALQEQLQKQKAITAYNVYDRKPPTMPVKNYVKPDMGKESPIKPDALHRQNTRSIHRSGSPPRDNQREGGTSTGQMTSRSVYRPASPKPKKPPMTQRTPQQAAKQRKHYETAGDLVRGNFLSGENLGDENSTLSRREELRNSYASLRSLQGDSIFIGVDDEEMLQMERKKPGAAQMGSNTRNYSNNDNDRNNRLGNLRQSYESQDSFDNEEGTYLDRFMIKNLPR